ncbi:redox-sensing transcriptional repressor Rex [Candidatus Arthromitus sp. SFB-mouse-Japan]|uniref:redox-sensing transcriptional repressor Rex n=1 Tax=unclassified Candidatus Neoarthromitus TaxID=2638829 RepID=UPI00021B7DBB|nr:MULTISPECIES: redox-sensing transcriptional repressor Rex [unclassified Candidatus Arthromitus]EIA23114.1 Redox-sensing transcriptional repressor [Candidatus Arthromitus sp. SFB-3]EIA23133.1 Redox-sensing transcriptional repressor rex [Candidatus Arthromitus sp. SFB-2]EIA27900.1 Redox-sensing transcriptional repressor rex [Candidatus Arthromitus sp. SFB-4]EIA29152.1 Redox-sensing transcriptional repressor rex [Candidatus Arthromitus sp. SFB-co]EIA30377.1 Redox-sensing transcriptional repres
MSSKISKVVIKRLPKYLRVLEGFLIREIERVSSRELAIKLGSTASQVRQDFNCFGDFGQHGYGYKVKELYLKIKEILGLSKKYNCIVIGAGNIGQAIMNYSKFFTMGFNIEAIFDINPKIIGLSFRGIEVLDIELLNDYIKNNKIDLAILCVPEFQAESIYTVLKDRVIGIWNFATVDLVSTEKTFVENVNLNDSLFTLTYFINNGV